MRKRQAMSDRMRTIYLSIGEISPGMTLAKPLALTEKRILRYMLPQGHVLTEGNIAQLASHHAEAVCVLLPDDRTDEEIAEDAQELESRLGKIFAHCDLTRPVMASFFNRVRSHLSR